jgi:hypothetical protein
MKQQTLMHSSILAAIIIAAVIGGGMLTGFPAGTPFISVDQISDKNAGDALAITGTTNLPNGTHLIVEVSPASFEQTIPDTGIFSGAIGGIDVIAGSGGINTWSMDVDTSQLQPTEYLVNVSVFANDTPEGSIVTTGPFNRTTFTVRPGSGNAGTAGSTSHAAAGGILIDPIRDTVKGKLLEVTGKTNLSAGTILLAKINPVSTQGGKLAADQKDIENFAVIKVKKDNDNNNFFSASFDTRFLKPADYIITLSDAKGGAPDVSSEQGPFSGSQVFNIIEGSAPSGQPATSLSAPSVYINPIDNVTAGDTVIVTGTTSVPPGSAFLVTIIPESMDETTIRTNVLNPQFSTKVSAVRGSSTTNLFSVPVPTRGLAPGQYILFVSAEKYEVTGSILFTVG